MKVVLVALIFLASCVHEPGGTGFATATSSSIENGSVLKVETICRGSVVDAIDSRSEPRIEAELTPRGGCWRKTCRGEKCLQTGNPGLPRESDGANRELAANRANEKRELMEKFGEACAEGRGDFDACYELAARLDKPEIDGIRKNLCVRKDEFRCVKKIRDLKTGSFTVSRMVTDLNCKADANGTRCTYTDIERIAGSAAAKADNKAR